MARTSGNPGIWLAACLALQAALLFWRLDLLPAWGDELFTLDTIAQPPGRIFEIVRGDIHPPLYYLLAHYWSMIPWPADPLVKVRALSGIWALATTAVFARLWVGRELWGRFLLVWALSPCLILYGRMARSYTMQMFLACVALYWGLELARDPKRRGAAAVYVVSAAALLYTHYLPGVAVIGATVVALLWRAGWKTAVISTGLIAALYAPWAASMSAAVGLALAASTRAVAANPLVEQGVRLGYLGVSFTVGETAPVWAIAAGVALAAAGITGRGWPSWIPLAGAAAVLGYLGAGRWVSAAFIPARMLFALPFYLLVVTRRAWVAAGIASLSVVSLAGYFGQRDFLNKGYLIPYERIAERIASQGPARVIVHPQGFDASPALRRARIVESAPVLWVIAAASGAPAPEGMREVRRERFVPYSDFDRAAMRWLGRPERTHVVEVVEYVEE